jgi:hypothetical protein
MPIGNRGQQVFRPQIRHAGSQTHPWRSDSAGKHAGRAEEKAEREMNLRVKAQDQPIELKPYS